MIIKRIAQSLQQTPVALRHGFRVATFHSERVPDVEHRSNTWLAAMNVFWLSLFIDLRSYHVPGWVAWALAIATTVAAMFWATKSTRHARAVYLIACGGAILQTVDAVAPSIQIIMVPWTLTAYGLAMWRVYNPPREA